jgi:hypothetical protein
MNAIFCSVMLSVIQEIAITVVLPFVKGRMLQFITTNKAKENKKQK